MNTVLSAGVRSSLLALNSLSDQLASAQKRLATGKRVNDPTDDPSAFFTAAGLSSRAAALTSVLAGVSSAHGAISAANEGAEAIQSLLSSAQDLANQALQSTASSLTTVTGTRTNLTAGTNIATNGGDSTHFRNNDTFTVSDGTTVATYTASNGDTVNTVLTAINGTAGLKVTASLVNGAFTLTADERDVDVTTGGTVISSGGLSGVLGLTAGTTSYTTNTTRQSLAQQFDSLRTQIDLAVQDAEFNGQNLLKGDSIEVKFNETGSSALTLSGMTATSSALGLTATANQWQDDDDIDAALSSVTTALSQMETQSSVLGSNIAVIDARETFTKSMVDELTTGAEALTGSDSNEDSALVLALQARQQLALTALSLIQNSAGSTLSLFA